MLLWLSHLMLAPFELANISIDNDTPPELAAPGGLSDLPGIAGDVMSIALEQLASSGKEREAASILLVRLSLRKDMQAHELPARLASFASQELLSNTNLVSLSPYKALGFLSLLYGGTNSGSDSEVAPYLQSLFDSIIKIATDPSNHFSAIRDSAPARKWIAKILRAIMTHALSLSSKSISIQPQELNHMLEESIQYFLDALSDKDTPVRMAAAKASSLVTLKLDPAMSADIVEAVLACLQENILLEDPHSQKIIAITDRAGSDILGMKRNISAVDPLRWHGLMLTLAHLLFRRSPPPEMLPEIIQSLLLGLEFEQRSNVGTSLGVGVRDAACFGLWTLARKYSTFELDLVSIVDFHEASRDEYADCKSVLQLIAVKLVISACLDPSGNIRRGSSAALQELIGRHPDTIAHGIPIVQVVDYHAIARLSRAMIEVAPQAALLGSVYHRPILLALTEWRGSRAADVNQRRWAANAIGMLTSSPSASKTTSFAQAVLDQTVALKPTNQGSTAAARHGLLLGLAATLRSIRSQKDQMSLSWLEADGSRILDLKALTGKMDGRVTGDVELAMEAMATLVGEISKWFSTANHKSAHFHETWTSAAADLLNHCTVVGVKENVIQTSAQAFVDLLAVLPPSAATSLIAKWLDDKQQPPSAFTSKGRLKTLSLIHGHLAQEEPSAVVRQKIVSFVMSVIGGHYKIETRVSAMEALGTILTHGIMWRGEAVIELSNVLQHGLTDYTNDQRGDIGSILRLQSLQTVDAYRMHYSSHDEANAILKDVMPSVVKLAAEKLNNVRFGAWKCLESFWRTTSSLPTLHSTFLHPADVSSVIYFQQLMELLSISWAQTNLVLGFVSSATSGTEDICRGASNAFVGHMQSLKPDNRARLVEVVSTIIVQELAARTTDDDRQVVPMLDFFCFMIDQDLAPAELVTQSSNVGLDMWSVMQKLHSPSSTLQRIEASLNVYSRMLCKNVDRARVLDKLTRQLLHRWPKIRNSAADLLYVGDPIETLASCDWNAPVAKTKPVVLAIRKELDLTSNQVPKG